MAEAHYADAKFYLKDALVEYAESAPDKNKMEKWLLLRKKKKSLRS